MVFVVSSDGSIDFSLAGTCRCAGRLSLISGHDVQGCGPETHGGVCLVTNAPGHAQLREPSTFRTRRPVFSCALLTDQSQIPSCQPKSCGFQYARRLGLRHPNICEAAARRTLVRLTHVASLRAKGDMWPSIIEMKAAKMKTFQPATSPVSRLRHHSTA